MTLPELIKAYGAHREELADVITTNEELRVDRWRLTQAAALSTVSAADKLRADLIDTTVSFPPGEPTLGDIANMLSMLRERGVTYELAIHAAERVWVEDIAQNEAAKANLRKWADAIWPDPTRAPGCIVVHENDGSAATLIRVEDISQVAEHTTSGTMIRRYAMPAVHAAESFEQVVTLMSRAASRGR